MRLNRGRAIIKEIKTKEDRAPYLASMAFSSVGSHGRVHLSWRVYLWCPFWDRKSVLKGLRHEKNQEIKVCSNYKEGRT